MTKSAKNWKDRFVDAKTMVVLDHAFFGCSSLQLGTKEDDGKITDTMATDGENIFVNPKFVDGLENEEIKFTICHEVMHVVGEHNFRMEHRNPKLWNDATDYVINWELRNVKGMKMPKDGLLDARFAGMSAEEVYDILLKEKKEKKDNEGDGKGNGDNEDNSPGDHGQCGGIIKPEGNPAEVSQKLAEQRMRTKQAIAIAGGKDAGNLPDSIKRMIEEAKPSVDWKAILRSYIDDACSQDYSWQKRSKSSLAISTPERSVYLPGLVNSGMSKLVIVVDTSGSINIETLNIFSGEIENAVNSHAIQRTIVMYADTIVQRTDEFELGDNIKMDAKGGGGTSFTDAFAKIKENHSDAPLIIYFTDLEVYDFGEEPQGAKVIWATYGSKQSFDYYAPRVPFGDAIHINE